MLSDEEIEERLRLDLHRLQTPLAELLSLQSKWNGEVRLNPFLPQAHAVFTSDGAIVIRPELYRWKIRWRILLHELVHSIAVDVGDNYYANLGWEEGPVEMLQRLIRPQLLSQAGISYDEKHLQAVEQFWPYQPYVGTIEEVRKLVGKEDSVGFYRDLLQIPIAERFAVLMRQEYDAGRVSIAKQIAVYSARLKTLLPSTPLTPEQRHLEEEVDIDVP